MIRVDLTSVQTMLTSRGKVLQEEPDCTSARLPQHRARPVPTSLQVDGDFKHCLKEKIPVEKGDERIVGSDCKRLAE
eukprot:244175-Hanusia_phi.AAC.1